MKKKAIVYATGERGIYVGRLERCFKRSIVPPTLLVSLEDELEVIDPIRRERVRAKSFLIPPGIDMEIDTHGANVALFFLNDTGADLARLSPLMRTTLPIGYQHCFADIKGESDVVEFANFLRNQRPTLATVEQLVHEWMFHPSRCQPNPDPRITRAVQIIKSNIDKNISVEWIGQQVDLSVPRLSQLFKEVVGTPIRRFRLWHRVFVTAAKLNEGVDLTGAALAAGFTDYAQFARTYRELAGGNASQARDNTQIVISGYV
ncbi:MAG: helix-turn-helix transcriptional regulator [Rhodoferax sp.]|nr:helix-turn-helix transcriptional regulator [Rhodoferax sp.]